MFEFSYSRPLNCFNSRKESVYQQKSITLGHAILLFPQFFEIIRASYKKFIKDLLPEWSWKIIEEAGVTELVNKTTNNKMNP